MKTIIKYALVLMLGLVTTFTLHARIISEACSNFITFVMNASNDFADIKSQEIEKDLPSLFKTDDFKEFTFYKVPDDKKYLNARYEFVVVENDHAYYAIYLPNLSKKQFQKYRSEMLENITSCTHTGEYTYEDNGNSKEIMSYILKLYDNTQVDILVTKPIDKSYSKNANNLLIIIGRK